MSRVLPMRLPVILLAFMSGLAAGSGVALAQSGDARGYSGSHGDGHAEMHPVYKNWKMPDTGYSCCTNEDCRPTRAFVDDQGRWRALNGGEWVVIPPEALLHVPSPDGRSHICMSQGAQLPRCFVPGEPRS